MTTTRHLLAWDNGKSRADTSIDLDEPAYRVTFTPVERDFTPRTQATLRLIMVAFLAVFLTIGVLSVVAPMPWSPLGRDQAPPQAPSRSTVQPDQDVRSA